MSRAISLNLGDCTYVGYVSKSHLKVFKYSAENSTFVDFVFVSLDMMILDAVMGPSYASGSIRIVVATSAGLRIYECSVIHTTGCYLLHQLDCDWSSNYEVCLTWLEGDVLRLLAGNGSALLRVQASSQDITSLICEKCHLTFAGGTKIESIRSETHDFQKIFELPGPKTYIVIIKKSIASCINNNQL